MRFFLLPLIWNVMAAGLLSSPSQIERPNISAAVDPRLETLSYLGGTQQDQITAVTVDGSGNIYLAGWTTSIDLRVTDSAFQEQKNGLQDAFVAKLSPDGATIVYLTYLGGSGNDLATDLAVDDRGRVYVTGSTSSTDFPVAQAFQEQSGGSTDAFLARLSENGSQLQFSTYLGGSQIDAAQRIQVDSSGRIYLSGTTRSQDFHLASPFQETPGGNVDAFVARFASEAGALEYSSFLGGSQAETVTALLVDDQERAVVIGFTRSPDFPTADPLQDASQGGDEIFAAQISADGQSLLFSTYLGGNASDIAQSAVLDDAGNLLLAGSTSSNNFPLEQPLQSLRAGATDLFLTRLKLEPESNAILSSTYLGGSGDESSRGIGVDGQGNIYLAGFTNSPDFPWGASFGNHRSGTDGLLVKLDRSASTILLATPLGGSRQDLISSLFVTPGGTVYAAGTTDSDDLPVIQPLQSETGARGMFRTTDGANSWNPSHQGLSDFNIRALAVDPSDPSIVYAGADQGGLFKSTDRGQTWVPTGLTAPTILSLAIDPQDPQVLYAGTASAIFKSTDQGETWKNRSLPLSTAVQSLAVDPSNSSVVYAGTASSGVWKTIDGGELWGPRNSRDNGLENLPNGRVFALAIDPKKPSRLYLGGQGGVWFSDNNGDNWQPTNLQNVGAVMALAVDPVDTSTLYASTFIAQQNVGNTVARSTDGGVTWNVPPPDQVTGPLLTGTVSALVIDPKQRQTLYAATFDAGIFKSTDASQTWQPVDSGLTSREVHALAIDPDMPSILHAGTFSGSDGFFTRLQLPNLFYFPQIAEGREGRLQFQTTLIFVNTGEDTSVRVEFFRSDGPPMTLNLGSLGGGSVFDIELKKGESISLSTAGAGPIQVGYARITAGDGVGGTAVFRRTDAIQGQTLFEAGVPASLSRPTFSFLLDSLGDKDTGLALVNPSTHFPSEDGSAEITMQLVNRDGFLLDETEMTLQAGQHRAAFVRQLFPDVAALAGEMQGTIRVTSNRPIAAVTLRQRDRENVELPMEVANLTAFPVILPNSLLNVAYFPQIGAARFQDPASDATLVLKTTLLFSNTGRFTLPVTLEFFDSAGEPLELELAGLGNGSSFQFPLAPNRFLFTETTATEEFQIGYARVTTSGLTLGGTAVFSQSDESGEITFFETGVPATRPLKEFSIFLDSLGARNTGLAMVNTSTEEEAEIEIAVFDRQFQLLGSDSLTLGPGEHLPRFVDQLLEDADSLLRGLLREMEGVVTVRSSQPLAAVTLRQKDDPTIPFPQEVPVLTAFPVIPNRAVD